MGSRRTAFSLGLVAAIVVLSIITIATAIVAIAIWRSGWNQSDRIAAVSGTFAAGTLALALVAGIVAILAYWVAIERPDVYALIDFPGSATNKPVLVVDPSVRVGGEVPAEVIANFPQINCRIRLDNRSPYSARNPVIRVELVNMWNLQSSGYWLPVSPATPGAKQAVRWSGAQQGSVTSVHGNDIADADVLSFANVTGAVDSTHEIVVIVLAEGFKRTQKIPVVLQDPSDWTAANPDRVTELPNHLRA